MPSLKSLLTSIQSDLTEALALVPGDSPSGALVSSVGTILVLNGDFWSIVPGSRLGVADSPAQQIAVNGVVDGQTGSVIELLSWKGLIYQHASAGWWAFVNGVWRSVPGDPRGQVSAIIPPAAQNAGFTHLDFSEDFVDITRAIDLANTGKPGFSFYTANAFDAGHTDPSVFSQIASGVRCTGPGAPNSAAQTWSRTGTTFAQVFGYTEFLAVIENPQSGASPGWASLWSLSRRHLDINNLDEFSERDLLEIQGGKATATIHDWGTTTPTGGHFQADFTGTIPADFDPRQPNRFAELHEDLGNARGRLSRFINDEFVCGITYGRDLIPFYCDSTGKNLGPIGGAVMGSFRINYTDSVALIFGTGANMPLSVLKVRHFSKPSST